MNDEKVILKVELLKYNRINIKISITDFFFFSIEQISSQAITATWNNYYR